MATVLCVWEQGDNLGHLANLRLPVEEALRLGHRVVLAVRSLSHVKEVLGDLPVEYVPAPFKQDPAQGGHRDFLSHTHLLSKQCFGSADELQMYLLAWRALYALLRPAVVFFEHSPTALLAAHDHGFRKVLVGNGFAAPVPSADPDLPFLPFPTTTLMPDAVEALRRDDQALLRCIHLAQKGAKAPALPALHAIYTQVHDTLLWTWPALDHYGATSARRYLGVGPVKRDAPVWPDAPGPKVFAYLRNMPALEAVLRDLHASGVCALLLVRDLPDPLRLRYSSARMRFIDQQVDLAQVAQQADWVLSHGNHGTTASFAAAGVPQLLIPLHHEHLFLALRLVARGAAVMAMQDQTGYRAAIDALLTNPLIARQAQALQVELPPYSDLNARTAVVQTLRAA